MIQPLGGDLLTGTLLHGFLHIVARDIGEQAVYPYTHLILLLILELSLAVDGPAQKPLGIAAAHDTAGNNFACPRVALADFLDLVDDLFICGGDRRRLPVRLLDIRAEFLRMSKCRILRSNLTPQTPAAAGTHFRTFYRCLILVAVDRSLSTASVRNKDKIIPYITDICKRDPRTGKVVTGGIVSCQDSKWLLSWTINRQGQFKDQDKDKVCVWVYGLFTDVPGDYIKKPMKDCTGKEITEEWLYHLGVPEDQIEDLAENSAVCVPTMMPYITAFFMPRTKGDRPDVIPDGCVNFAFLGQFADTPRDTVFTTEYSVRTAMEAVYGLLGVDRGVPEVWGSVYDIRELLSSSVKLMDGKSPLEIDIPGANLIKKPLLHFIRGTVIEKVLRDYEVLKDGM